MLQNLDLKESALVSLSILIALLHHSIDLTFCIPFTVISLEFIRDQFFENYCSYIGTFSLWININCNLWKTVLIYWTCCMCKQSPKLHPPPKKSSLTVVENWPQSMILQSFFFLAGKLDCDFFHDWAECIAFEMILPDLWKKDTPQKTTMFNYKQYIWW